MTKVLNFAGFEGGNGNAMGENMPTGSQPVPSLVNPRSGDYCLVVAAGQGFGFTLQPHANGFDQTGATNKLAATLVFNFRSFTIIPNPITGWGFAMFVPGANNWGIVSDGGVLYLQSQDESWRSTSEVAIPADANWHEVYLAWEVVGGSTSLEWRLDGVRLGFESAPMNLSASGVIFGDLFTGSQTDLTIDDVISLDGYGAHIVPGYAIKGIMPNSIQPVGDWVGVPPPLNVEKLNDRPGMASAVMGTVGKVGTRFPAFVASQPQIWSVKPAVAGSMAITNDAAKAVTCFGSFVVDGTTFASSPGHFEVSMLPVPINSWHQAYGRNPKTWKLWQAADLGADDVQVSMEITDCPAGNSLNLFQYLIEVLEGPVIYADPEAAQVGPRWAARPR